MGAESAGTGRLTARFDEALSYASRLHASQIRKGSGIPYVSHLLAVAALVLEHGADEDEAIAALLHDAVEDQGGDPTRAEIERRFGARVAAIVDGCTDTDVMPKPPWRARKDAYIQHLGEVSPSVLLVSVADKLHNARAILADYREIGDELWTRFTADRDQQLWYYRSLVGAYRERSSRPPAGGSPGLSALVDQLDDVVTELDRSIAADARRRRAGAYTEIEAKWRLADADASERLRQRLTQLGARPTGSHTEANQLFDHKRELGRSDQVLRIRTLDGGPGAILTWKGPAARGGGLKRRAEVELGVDDAARMRETLEGLGYRIDIEYPKVRATWVMGNVEIALDELPFGHFCELEGPESEIRALATRLGLDPAQTEPEGYPALMRRYLHRRGG